MKFSPLWLLYVTIPLLSACDITNEALLESGQITGSTVIPNTVATAKVSLLPIDAQEVIDTSAIPKDTIPTLNDSTSSVPDSVFLYFMDDLQTIVRRVAIKHDGSFAFVNLSMGDYSIRSCNDSLGFEYHNIQLSDAKPAYDVGSVIFSEVTLRNIQMDSLSGMQFFSFEKQLTINVDGSILYPSLIQKVDSNEHYYQVVTVHLNNGTYQNYLVLSNRTELTITDLPKHSLEEDAQSSSLMSSSSSRVLIDPVESSSQSVGASSGGESGSSSSGSGIVIRYSFSNPD
ncbi:MAG: hypothetical protein OCC49_14840 [Fibrobacterales bacterium]